MKIDGISYHIYNVSFNLIYRVETQLQLINIIYRDYYVVNCHSRFFYMEEKFGPLEKKH